MGRNGKECHGTNLWNGTEWNGKTCHGLKLNGVEGHGTEWKCEMEQNGMEWN